MDIEKFTTILQGISIALSRIIVIIAPILAAVIIGAVKAGAVSVANINPVKERIESLKQLTHQDKI